MGRRRRNKDADRVEAVIGLVGMLFLLSFLSPQLRAVFMGLGGLLLVVLILAAVDLIGFAIFKRSKSSNTTDTFLNANLPEPSISRPSQSALQTPANVIHQLRKIDWFQFEKLVELVYRKLGYSVTKRGGANPDGGIDLVIEKDGAKIAIQCKQWKTWNVGVKAVREFLGALTDANIQSGIFITLNGYSGEAKALAEKHGIQIINETGLAEMLENTNAVSDRQVLAIFNDARKFCPKCESEMALRTAGKGLNAGQQFWGCSRYPKCRFTMQIS